MKRLRGKLRVFSALVVSTAFFVLAAPATSGAEPMIAPSGNPIVRVAPMLTGAELDDLPPIPLDIPGQIQPRNANHCAGTTLPFAWPPKICITINGTQKWVNYMTGRVFEGYPRGFFEMQTPSGVSWVSAKRDARDGAGVRWDINDFVDYGEYCIGFWGENYDGSLEDDPHWACAEVKP